MHYNRQFTKQKLYKIIIHGTQLRVTGPGDKTKKDILLF